MPVPRNFAESIVPTKTQQPIADVAIVGGSGLYGLRDLTDVEQHRVETPFGAPSDAIHVGTLGDRRVAVLARHGQGHTLLPGEVNYRANIFALKQLGVQRLLSASAVGSMREGLRPRDVVLVDQFIDRTVARPSTFFGDGLVAHVSLADPICPSLRAIMLGAARSSGARSHDGGVYVCIEGPAFSTRAESKLYRSWGVDVIGMTNMQEARLAREAEICYASMAMITDYDCWHEDEDDVSVDALLGNLQANAELAAESLRRAVLALPAERDGCPCCDALRYAILTDLRKVPPETVERLGPILERYAPRGSS
ncbi:MAG: S-methyl-5'-thioadenosine phosphorylase [bacterium]|nr:S-methyl-5'-thioadenosine phosphorylase [bacterium]